VRPTALKTLLLSLTLAGLAAAQSVSQGRATTSVQPSPQAQPVPPTTIGVLDFFGLNKTTGTRLRSVIGVKEGDPLPASKGDTEEHLVQVAGIVQAHLEAVCCDESKLILYVGIEERGAPHFDLHEPPEGEVVLPQEITSLYRDFLSAADAATRRGSTAEDLTKGYSLMADRLAREIQIKFVDLVKDNLPKLNDVLRNSADDEQRAIAAYLIGYEPRQKARVASDLQYALRDAEPGVRANAVRALIALAVYARLHPDDGVKIQPTWFVEMLNSLSWSDRDNAMRALQLLTDQRDATTLELLRERALPALSEMARWKTLSHALPAFILIGRVEGMTDDQIHDAWNRGDRESVIASAGKKKSR